MTSANLPALPWHGGCQCGAVRYRVTGHPLTLYCCHCTECQKQSASMFGMSMIFKAHFVEFTGKMEVWTRATDSGNTTDCHFCPACGSRLYHQGSQRKETGTLTLKAGSLDNAAQIAPVGHIWLDSASRAFEPKPDQLVYPRQPENYEALIEAFHNHYGIPQGG